MQGSVRSVLGIQGDARSLDLSHTGSSVGAKSGLRVEGGLDMFRPFPIGLKGNPKAKSRLLLTPRQEVNSCLRVKIQRFPKTLKFKDPTN